MGKDLVKQEGNFVNIDNIYKDIKDKIILARGKMLKQIDSTMVAVYWENNL